MSVMYCNHCHRPIDSDFVDMVEDPRNDRESICADHLAEIEEELEQEISHLLWLNLEHGQNTKEEVRKLEVQIDRLREEY